MGSAVTIGSIRHNNDADFRAWSQEFHDILVGTMGLVQTADTGQVDLSTATRPSTGAYAGFRIYRTNDGLTDLFIRIQFGTNTSSSTFPRMTVQVGTGTDGAGNLNGMVTNEYFAGANRSITAGKWLRIATGVDGLWHISFHRSGYGLGAQLGFTLARICNLSGAPSNDGFRLYATNGAEGGGGAMHTIRLLPTPNNFGSTNSASFAMAPNGIDSTVLDGRPQVFMHQAAIPEVRPIRGLVSYRRTEIGEATAFTLRVGGVDRTYMPLGQYMIQGAVMGVLATGDWPYAVEWA